MIDWDIVELQSREMEYEIEIAEVFEDRDWDKLETLVVQYNKFRKANKNWF